LNIKSNQRCITLPNTLSTGHTNAVMHIHTLIVVSKNIAKIKFNCKYTRHIDNYHTI